MPWVPIRIAIDNGIVLINGTRVDHVLVSYLIRDEPPSSLQIRLRVSRENMTSYIDSKIVAIDVKQDRSQPLLIRNIQYIWRDDPHYQDTVMLDAESEVLVNHGLDVILDMIPNDTVKSK